MQRDSDRQGEEDAWRAIVENYGDRVTLDDPDESHGAESLAPAPPDPEPGPAPLGSALAAYDEMQLDEERFVPPPPPPVPAVPRDRLAAWVGLFGAPTILLVCVVAGVSLPELVAYLLVGAFVGGFLYLVVTMQNGPADPWDDGARL